jgi:hypothetical protein
MKIKELSRIFLKSLLMFVMKIFIVDLFSFECRCLYTETNSNGRVVKNY